MILWPPKIKTPEIACLIAYFISTPYFMPLHFSRKKKCQQEEREGTQRCQNGEGGYKCK
jgi:hypothetical protein